MRKLLRKWTWWLNLQWNFWVYSPGHTSRCTNHRLLVLIRRPRLVECRSQLTIEKWLEFPSQHGKFWILHCGNVLSTISALGTWPLTIPKAKCQESWLFLLACPVNKLSHTETCNRTQATSWNATSCFKPSAWLAAVRHKVEQQLGQKRWGRSRHKSIDRSLNT